VTAVSAHRHTRLFVIRHADAGIRRDGPGDRLRSLVPEGRDRARVIADLLAPVAVGDIVSSPFTRCIQTVEPLAAKRGRPVETSDALAEPADVAAMLHLLRSLPDGSVACTHGDMLGDLVDALVDARLRRNHPIATDKGVVWVLSRTAESLSLIGEIGEIGEIGGAAGRAGRCRRTPDSSATPVRTGQDDRRSMVHG
jgi:8-oxo-dGTP diphosphatase